MKAGHLLSPGGDSRTRPTLRLRNREVKWEENGNENIPEKEAKRSRNDDEDSTEIPSKKAKLASKGEEFLVEIQGEDTRDSTVSEGPEDLQVREEEENGEDPDKTLTPDVSFNNFPDIDSEDGDVEEETDEETCSQQSELELIIYGQATSSELDGPLEPRLPRSRGYTLWDIED